MSIFYTKKEIKSSELVKNEEKDRKIVPQKVSESLVLGENGQKLCTLHKK
jgi:hypothetical protein